MVRGRPEEHAVNYAVLRSLQRAVYSPEEEGHYALASECYCHFTSPIRRYPDLTIHRLLGAVLSRKRAVNDFAELVVLGEHCSDRERRAEAAERELTKVKLLYYLEKRIGDEMDAVVTGVEEFGLFAQGIQLPAEGLVHVTTLSDDFYRFDRRSHTLTGRRAGNTLSPGRSRARGSGASRYRSPRAGFPDRGSIEQAQGRKHGEPRWAGTQRKEKGAVARRRSAQKFAWEDWQAAKVSAAPGAALIGSYNTCVFWPLSLAFAN